MVNMDVFEVEIVSTENIKPSSPTPSHLKIFKLSLLDQITPSAYIPVTFFYPHIMSDDTNLNVNQILHKLKVSLSDALSIFYPLAGRIKDHLSVDCNDEGVLFLQAKVNYQLSEFLNPPDTSLLARLLPVVEISMERQNEAVQVAIQVNVFTCGGISIGILFLHRIMDAATLQAFLSCWAAIATRSSKDRETYPDVNAASLFPPRRDSQTQDDQVTFLFKQKWFLKKEGGVWKRFVFDAAAISALKAKVASEAVPNPSRFQVVASFIWKSAISASKALGSQKPSLILFPVNMRPKMVPPMSQNSIGNIVWHTTAHHWEESVELRSTVDLLRGAIQKINGDHIQSLQGDQRFVVVTGTLDNLRNMYLDEKPELYICGTWCGLGFYDVDFGWGKPIWVISPVQDKLGIMYPNAMALMDSKSGDGIEAMMFLPETHMAKLLCDAEFLSFVSINPTISVPSAPN